MKRRRWLRILGSGAVATGAGWFAKNQWLSAGPGWHGELSGHFDGERFFNPGGPSDRGFLDFLRWQLSGGRVSWPETAGGLVESALPKSLSDGELAVTFVGHATFLLQWRGLNVLTDPVWSVRCSPLASAGPKRVRPPGLSWDSLPPIHVVLVSHNHYDHLDLSTLRRLHERDQPLILTGLGNRVFLESRGLRRVVELDWWQSHEVDGARFTFTPAVHWSSRGGWGRNATLWGGFAIRGKPQSAFFAGDTGYGAHFSEIRRRLGGVSIALLPIGAYEPQWFMRPMHMHPEDAVRAHRDLDASASLGMHFGTWQLTNEGIDEPIRALDAARTAAGISADEFAAPTFGQTRRLG